MCGYGSIFIQYIKLKIFTHSLTHNVLARKEERKKRDCWGVGAKEEQPVRVEK
ncbi:hypothetical protein Scep_023889 [Stephania cephalantha]|uniref:Uncharacterized protein n=1 Tax=Stephania cephalantha TaxID=152367 RepID=A0AAP0EW12_9MAGN